jgi:hypothetical protein
VGLLGVARLAVQAEPITVLAAVATGLLLRRG